MKLEDLPMPPGCREAGLGSGCLSKMYRFKGFVDLVCDAVEQTTNLVERTHRATAERSVRRFAPIEPLATPARAVNAVQQSIAHGVYETTRTVNRAARTALGSGFELIEAEGGVASDEMRPLATPMNAEAVGSLSWVVDYAQSSINGLFGDWLSRKGSLLAPTMHLFHAGRPLPTTEEAFVATFEEPTNRLAVFVHGLGCTEWTWNIGATQYYGDPTVNFGSQLQRDCGYTPLYVRYNTGLRVAENGRSLSDLLTEVLSAYPVEVDEIALIGHSMGGLVSRSAAHYGALHGQPWVPKLRHVVSIATPHHGAPLEKAVNLTTGTLRRFETAATQVISELLGARSSGIKDLRYGYITDAEGTKHPEAMLQDSKEARPLLLHVAYYFVAATISKDHEHPIGQVIGDMLVRLPSAKGHDREPARRIPFHSGHVLGGVSHLRLANHPEVYQALRAWVDDPENRADAHSAP
ncbi:MAG: alpha/beta hydrolase [Myxococcales bacterium]|nr:alpha/beta hydrolase [Myxococcales bacterium]